ncbi:hypothetical protein TEPIDINF_002723 [Tepidibacillus infernus]|uniref:hypothetical protein n=1 Tax=Tepidibacillus infernus TaxID=1806172 RepID=UPI003B73C89B
MVMLTWLYPTKIRAIAQGFVYNIGRGFCAFAPFVVGTLALTFGLGTAFWVTSAAFLLGVLSVLLLPETKGKLLN